MRRRPRLALALAGAWCLALALPAAAAAHGLVGRQDLPIPRWLFAWGAAVVLVVSFVALAVLWPTPRLERREAGRRILRFPAILEVLAGLLGVALFAAVVYAGLAGSQSPTSNLAPTAIYVLVWVGVPFASILLGDVFRAFNPWRATARGAAWIAGRVTAGRGDALPPALEYPTWLGRWPAALGILAFAWRELVATNGADPSTLAILALFYAGVQLVGMSLVGIDRWSDNADAFGVYFGLFGSVAPLRWRARVLEAVRPLSGTAQLAAVPGTVALLCVAIGTTSFDGLSEGPAWSSVAPDLQTAFIDLGLTQEGALRAVFTLGLVGMVLLVAAFYRLGVLGMRFVDRRREAGSLARRFAHSLVPIALAYVVAHYFSLLAYQGQATAYLASDPLGEGSDLFGTATSAIDYSVVSANGIWYVQVGALVLGHVAALVLAHDRALATWEQPRTATRSQYWMLLVMLGFTSLGLWLLSAGAA